MFNRIVFLLLITLALTGCEKINDLLSQKSSVNSADSISQITTSKAPEQFKEANEKELLSSAITRAKNITIDTPIKDKLVAYEDSLGRIDKILDLYGSTDVGLQLKSSDRFGDFSVTDLRSDYLNELTSYYRKVCEVSPSSICLGFNSFSSGAEQCKNATDLNSYIKAHDELLNAYKIMNTQQNSDSFKSPIKNAYFGCLGSAATSNPNWVNYFRFQFAKLMIESGDLKYARGLIEKLNDPYYKFASVLRFAAAGAEEVNDAFFDRMKKYSSENFHVAFQQSMSNMALTNLYIKSDGKVNLKRSKVFDFYGNPFLDIKLKCQSIEAVEYYSEFINVAFSYYESSSLAKDRINDFSAEFHFLNQSANSYLISKSCYRQYDIASAAIVKLLIFGHIKEARKFNQQFLTGNISANRLGLIDSYLDIIVSKDSNSLKDLKKIAIDSKGMEWSYAVFKKLVDAGKVCDAASIMKDNLRDTPYYANATTYLGTSNAVANSKKYSCGSESLELLLK